MCLGLLGDPEKARDATQETGLRFLKQLARFRGDSKLMTWSMGIAINVVRESRRSSKKAITDDGQIADGRPAPGDSPEQSASGREQRDLLRTILAELPERQREAVTLRFFEELSVEETAKAMNCAEGTIKATIHQALKSLKTRLTTRRPA